MPRYRPKEKKQGGKKVFVLGFLLIVFMTLILSCLFIFQAIKSDINLDFEKDNLESYSTNIANSYMLDTKLLMPAEILSGLASEYLDKDVRLLAYEGNINLYLTVNFYFLGECDLSVSLKLDEFDASTGLVNFSIGDVKAGIFTLPNFLKDMVIDDIKGDFLHKIEETDSGFSLTLPHFDINYLGNELNVNVTEMKIDGENIYFKTNVNSNTEFLKDLFTITG